MERTFLALLILVATLSHAETPVLPTDCIQYSDNKPAPKSFFQILLGLFVVRSSDNNPGIMHYNRGTALMNSKDTSVYREAFCHLYQSAALGCKEAYINLGFAYSMGIGIPKDTAAAIAMYLRAGNNGNKLGWSNLASVAWNPQKVDLQNDSLTFMAVQKALEQNSKSNLRMLRGQMFFQGRGTNRDTSKALEDFRISQRQQIPQAAASAVSVLFNESQKNNLLDPLSIQQILSFAKSSEPNDFKQNTLATGHLLNNATTSYDSRKKARKWIENSVPKSFADSLFLWLYQLSESSASTQHKTWLALSQKANEFLRKPKSECNMECQTLLRYHATGLLGSNFGHPDTLAALRSYRYVEAGAGVDDPTLNSTLADLRSQALREPIFQPKDWFEKVSSRFRQLNNTERKMDGSGPLQLQVEAVALAHSGWDSLRVMDALNDAQLRLGQCGISIDTIRFRIWENTKAWPSSTTDTSRASIEKNYDFIGLGKSATIQKKSIHMVFGFQSPGEQAGQATSNALRISQIPTIYFKPYKWSIEPKGILIAHEMGHILGEMGHPADWTPSIMHYSGMASGYFSETECQRMRAWPWLSQK